MQAIYIPQGAASTFNVAWTGATHIAGAMVNSFLIISLLILL